MPEHIDLTELRERATFESTIPAAFDHMEVHIPTLLALIDTTETAIELFDDQPEIQADYPQLHETLNQFDRTPPNE